MADGKIKELEMEERISALGKNLDQIKNFDPQSMQDTFDALNDYRHIIEKQGVKLDQTLVTATEAARTATNAKSFFRDIEDRLGFRVHVITPEGEAYYTYRGVVQNDTSNISVIMDMGGASTELIKVSDGSLEGMISFPMGAVRGSDWRMNSVFDERVQDILASERSRVDSFQTSCLIGVGGTMTSLAAISKNMMDFDRESIEGCTIDYRDLKNCVEEIERQSEEDLNKKFPFLGKRIKSIKAGGHLALIIGEFLRIQSWKISTRGLRYGTILDGTINERFEI